MGRVSSYKKPKAVNDPRRYEQLLFGDRYNDAPVALKNTRTSVRQKRHLQAIARAAGKPDPFAKTRHTTVATTAAKTSSTKKKEPIDNTTESELDESITPLVEAETSTITASSNNGEADDANELRSASDIKLNAKIASAVLRRTGESLKDYKNRLKRERNRILKVQYRIYEMKNPLVLSTKHYLNFCVHCVGTYSRPALQATAKQAHKRTAKSKNYFANKKVRYPCPVLLTVSVPSGQLPYPLFIWVAD